MANASSSEKYEIYFIRQRKSLKNAISNRLQLAFEAMNSHQLEPSWISIEDCLKTTKKENKLFVIDPFQGKVYDHLLSHDCRIIGPLCVLMCLQLGEALPMRPHPVYSVSMRKITVSCSNLEKDLRTQLSSLITQMGGSFSRDLTRTVTHLIAGEVGSKKYHVAANFNLPIMLPTWVTEIWENGQNDQVHASDPIYAKFRCPVFKGLSITVSQFSSDNRKKYKSMIESNGGRYSGAMKSKDTTHLVLMEAKGDKHRFATSWKLYCVTAAWIEDSIKAGYCKDETLYKLESSEMPPPPSRSTPNKDKCANFSIDCSSINATFCQLEETRQSDISMFICEKNDRKSSLTALDVFDTSTLPKCGQFLDGCKIFLSGFKTTHMDKLRKIVNSGGGIRFNNYSESVSHMIYGENNPTLIDAIKSSSVKPYVVTFDWLLNCCKQQKLVDEGPFSCLNLQTLSLQKEPVLEEELSQISQNVLSLNKDADFPNDFSDILDQYAATVDKPVNPNKSDSIEKSVKLASNEADSREEVVRNSRLASNKSDLVEKSARSNRLASNESDSMKKSVRNSRLASNKADSMEKAGRSSRLASCETVEKSVRNKRIAKHEASAEEVPNVPTEANSKETIEIADNPCPSTESSDDTLFNNKTFRVYGFDTNEANIISDMILNHGGSIPRLMNKEVDVAIVPLIWSNLKINAKVIVTNCWLQKCIEENSILQFDENELFSPFKLNFSSPPLKDLVISISQYSGTERDCLMHLTQMLGAQCQEFFVRKHNASRGLLPNTHLVASDPEGSKYEAAKKWKIPAVTKFWLLAAAKTNTLPLVDNYLVGAEVPKDSTMFSDIICMTKDSTIQTTETPAVNLMKPVPTDNVESRSINNWPPKIPDVNHSELLNASKTPCAQNSRVKALISESKSTSSLDLLSPVRLEGKVTFDVAAMLKELNMTITPDDCSIRRDSTPFTEVFERNLAKAAKNARRQASKDVLDALGPDTDDEDPDETCPLKGVVTFVSKKLYAQELDINRIVQIMGGKFVWTFSDSCTHYVFQGKQNDLSKEFRLAKQLGKHIISPDWVYACQEANARVPESNYPHTFNGRLTLSQISTSKTAVCNQSTPVIPKQPGTPEVREQSSLKNSLRNGKVRNEQCPADNSPRNGVINNDVSEQLDEIIVAAKSAKAGKRRTRLNFNLSGESPSEAGNNRYSTRSSTSSPVIKNIFANAALRASENCQEAVEASQSIPITWDDPMERMEREKIAASMTHTSDKGLYAGRKNSLDLNLELELENDVFEVCSSSKKKFMFSLLIDDEKKKYTSYVVQLGGEVSNSVSFDSSATHLITKQVVRNEKFLSSVASGKWILHQSYLDDSFKSGKFLSEELYEWDGNTRKPFINNQSESCFRMSLSAKRWRKKMQNSGGLPFMKQKIIIVAPAKKKEGYSKILVAGGAEIVPFTSNVEARDITYAFVEVSKNIALSAQFKSLLSKDVCCLKTDYIAAYLIDDPPPSSETFRVTGSEVVSTRKRTHSP